MPYPNIQSVLRPDWIDYFDKAFANHERMRGFVLALTQTRERYVICYGNGMTYKNHKSATKTIKERGYTAVGYYDLYSPIDPIDTDKMVTFIKLRNLYGAKDAAMFCYFTYAWVYHDCLPLVPSACPECGLQKQLGKDEMILRGWLTSKEPVNESRLRDNHLRYLYTKYLTHRATGSIPGVCNTCLSKTCRHRFRHYSSDVPCFREKYASDVTRMDSYRRLKLLDGGEQPLQVQGFVF